MVCGVDQPPLWIDAHGAPIPEALWDMLAHVVSHPRLCHLKGMALEVDTKSVPLIVREFERFQARFGEQLHVGNTRMHNPMEANAAGVVENVQHARHDLDRQYERYARLVSMEWHDIPTPELPLLGSSAEELDLYRGQYLPHEILEWGGSLREMFPQTCRRLDDRGVALSKFVEYWFRKSRPTASDYDYFLLKLQWFVDFVNEVLPDAVETVTQEADELRTAYELACRQTDSESYVNP
jgi:signal transduction histidine kinase